MRALTLWQPWASLIAWGAKRYETRSWETTYRGPIAIHAAMNQDMSVELFRTNSFYRKVFEARGLTIDEIRKGLRMGVVVAVVDLIDIEKTERLIYGERKVISQQEENFGDWTCGRYAWKLGNVRELVEPIPAMGRQQVWEWRMELEALADKFTKG
jgi:hypothetical protein